MPFYERKVYLIMNNLIEIVTFRDGFSLDDGTAEFTERFLGNVGHICDLGRHFGLALDKFEIDSEFVYFEWRGRKRDLLKFYTYYSKNMTSEPPESRKAAQLCILNK